MADTIQGVPDAQLLTIVDQLRTVLTENLTYFPMVTSAMKSHQDTLRVAFITYLEAHTSAQAAAKAATADKAAARAALEKAVRDIRNLCKASGVEEAKMTALGIPSSSVASPATATIPVAVADTSQRMRHTIRWSDGAANGNKKKPRGTMGAEIWIKIDGPAPGSEKDCTFLTLDSATPYLAEFDAADAGKTAHYMIRWRMQDGSIGAWGETVSATITA
jgi:hypothetical protein